MKNLDLRHKDMLRGLVFITGGAILLLHTLGYLQQSVRMILVIFALASIAYGFIKSGLYEMTIQAMRKKQ